VPRAYWRFNYPCALTQGDGPAWPALAGSPIGCHCYLEVLDASQVLDNLRAIDAPHVDAVQEVKPGAHNWRQRPLSLSGLKPAKAIGGQAWGDVQTLGDLSGGQPRALEA
jgi:hypothetical protein